LRRMQANQARPGDKCSECDYRELRLFCNLKDSALQRFDEIGIKISYPGRVKIFGEGERSDGVFVMCTGQAKLSATSKDGRTMILKISGPGDVLGLGAMMNNLPYEVTAETLEPCKVKAVKRAEFESFMSTYGEVSHHAAQSLAREYNDAFLDARRLGLSGSAAGKLAQLLLQWGRTTKCGRPELRFTMALTHEELANMAGVSRETVTRLLNQFERDKLIRRTGASIVILDASRLEAESR
jgi:CRP/FNR family cyclic AMP-dependent transcriptional regulator